MVGVVLNEVTLSTGYGYGKRSGYSSYSPTPPATNGNGSGGHHGNGNGNGNGQHATPSIPDLEWFAQLTSHQPGNKKDGGAHERAYEVGHRTCGT